VTATVPEAPIELTTVIVGSYDASLLNPDWVERKVLKDLCAGWRTQEPPISTPVFSRVVYDSGIAITIDERSVQFRSDPPNGELLADIVERIREVMQHVDPRAVGNNSKWLAPAQDPDILVIEKYVSKRDHLVAKGLVSARLKFTFAGDGYNANISIDPGTFVHKTTQRTTAGVMTDINIHRDVADNDEAVTAARLLTQDIHTAHELVKDVLQ